MTCKLTRTLFVHLNKENINDSLTGLIRISTPKNTELQKANTVPITQFEYHHPTGDCIKQAMKFLL